MIQLNDHPFARFLRGELSLCRIVVHVAPVLSVLGSTKCGVAMLLIMP